MALPLTDLTIPTKSSARTGKALHGIRSPRLIMINTIFLIGYILFLGVLPGFPRATTEQIFGFVQQQASGSEMVS
jgi:hypothetical protein